MKSNHILLATALFTLVNISTHAQSVNCKVQKIFSIPGNGWWDYLAISPVSGRLYVAHGTEVNIVDKTDGTIKGVITNTPGVHGIAFAVPNGKGYTSNGKSNNVTVFDLKTDRVTGSIATGENPDAIMYEPFSKMIIVCNGRSKDLTIIDPSTDKVLKVISLGGKPETAVSDEQGRLYVNIEDKNEIVVLNTQSFEVMYRWPTGSGDEPSGLAIDIKTKRLFAGCGNKKLIVVDTDNGKVIKEVAIGEGCDGVVFDPALKQVYSSNGSGTLTIIKEKSANEYVVVANMATKQGARTIALDPATHLLYLPTAAFGKAQQGKRAEVIPGSFEVLVVSAGN